ncbi:MAG: efflux RND transporter periplasmic adaptor subunit [Candidatus Berkiella sp.]
MSGHNTRAIALTLGIILLGAIGGTIFYQRTSKPPADANIATVTVAQPIKQEITEWDEYTGRFEADERIDVRARVGGYLESVHFTDGEIVKKDQLLFVIDPRPYQAALNQAQAAIVAAQTKADYAANEFKRSSNLVKSGSVSQGDFDEKRQQQEQTIADVQAAKAAAERARLDLEFTKITAPISGKISNKKVSEGNLITGGNQNATLLATIVSLDPIHFYFDIDEQNYLKYVRMAKGYLNPVKENREPVFVALMDDKAFNRKGYMDFIDNRIDESTGTLRGRALFENPDFVLLPGLFGRIKIMGQEPYSGILINDEAIMTDQSRKYVFVVDSEGVVSTRTVTLGPIIDGKRVIREGLQGNEWIITKGIQRARDGAKVNVKK